MKIVVGLGNPGEKYKKTRHNTGFLFVKYMEEKYSFEVKKSLCDALVGEAKINNEKVIFALPQTFMNLSGNALQKLIKWYKVDTKDVVIIFDDIDIPFGDIRYKERGSGGTHNGMKNIVQMVATEEIPRIKVGMGNLKNEKQPLMDFVLDNFRKEELKELEENIFTKVEEKLLDFIDN